MSMPYDIVFCGLSLSSSWGNGHATTYRSLLKGLHDQGQRLLFLERDVPWYAAHRDLVKSDYCNFVLYEDLDELFHRFGAIVEDAGAVVVGSYVPQAIALIDRIRHIRRGLTAFYDIDTPVTLEMLSRGEEE